MPRSSQSKDMAKENIIRLTKYVPYKPEPGIIAPANENESELYCTSYIIMLRSEVYAKKGGNGGCHLVVVILA